MVRFGKFVLTLGVLVALASPAWAQQQKGGRGFGFGMGGGGFLNAPVAQKDLKLTDAQIAKVEETLRSVREKHADDFAAMRDLAPEERGPKMVSLGKEINDEIKKELALSPEQSKRYDQITIQQQGLMAFMSPTVAEKLKLTEDQRTQIREIAMSGGPGRGAGGFNKDASKEERAEAAKKAMAARSENMKKVMALLSDDQKKEWKELTGEPIEIPFGGFGGGRRPNNN